MSDRRLFVIARAGEPTEVAAAVMFLVSSQAAYISGANLSVSGGR